MEKSTYEKYKHNYKKWYESNKEQISIKNKLKYQNNKELYQIYYIENKKRLNQYSREYWMTYQRKGKQYMTKQNFILLNYPKPIINKSLLVTF